MEVFVRHIFQPFCVSMVESKKRQPFFARLDFSLTVAPGVGPCTCVQGLFALCNIFLHNVTEVSCLDIGVGSRGMCLV